MKRITVAAFVILSLSIPSKAYAQELSLETIEMLVEKAKPIANSVSRHSQLQEWNSGPHTTKATIVSLVSGKVNLRKENGKLVKVEFAKLDKDCRANARSFLKAKHEAEVFLNDHGISASTVVLISKLARENQSLRRELAEKESLQALQVKEPKVELAKSAALVFSIDESTVYIPTTNKPDTDLLVSFVRLSFNGERTTAGLFNVGGKPVRPLVTSSDPSVVKVIQVGEVHPEMVGGALTSSELIRFLKPGNVVLRAEVAGHETSCEVSVVQVPIELGMSANDVIESIGFPSSKKHIFASWPNSRTADKMRYFPRAGKSISGEHWRFEKYPGLVVSIIFGKVKEIGSCAKQ
jgi:hypothetical protein